MSLIDKPLNEVSLFVEALEVFYDANLTSLVDLFIVFEQLLNYLFKDVLLVCIF